MNAVNKKLILLVEDEIIMSKINSETIKGFGYDVLIAQTGEKAIELALNNNKIDLVLMDINLGKGIDGTEAARQILSQKNIPIVFLTSHTEREMVEKVRGITRYGYIIKNSGNFVLHTSIEMAFDLFEAQEKLDIEKEHLKATFNSIGDGVITTDIHENITRMNPIAENLTGWNISETIGKSINDIFNIIKSQNYNTQVRNFNQTDNHTELISKKGERFRISYSREPIKNIKGNVTGEVLVFRDITENYKQEKKLRLRESYLSAIIENQPGLLWLKDIDSKFLIVNTKFSDSCCLENPDCLIGKSDLDIWPLELAQKYIADDKKVIDLGKPLMTEEQISDKGVGTWFETFKAPIIDDNGKVIGTTGYSREINERKKSEEAILMKNMFLDAVANSSVDGILVVNNKSEKILQNQRAIDLWKIPKEVVDDISGLKQVAHVMHMTKNPQQFVDNINYLRDRPNEICGDELELIDGTVLERYSSPVLGSDGKNYGRVWIFHDITSRKRSENEVKSLLIEKDLILKEVHHRIKNHMNTISSLLILQANTLKEPVAIEALNDAVSRVRSMMILYDKLYQSDVFSDMHIKGYFSDLIDQIINNFPNSSIVKINKNIEDIILNSKKLSTLGIIINELITNIMKYAFIGHDKGTINVSVTLKDNHVSLVITDDGNGLPKSVNFENSTGFGLTLVGILTKQIEGTIRIERDNGTRIMLEFDR